MTKHEHPDLEETVELRLTKNQALIVSTAAAQFGNIMALWKADLSPGELASLTMAVGNLNAISRSNPTIKRDEEATKALAAAIIALCDFAAPKIQLQ